MSACKLFIYYHFEQGHEMGVVSTANHLGNRRTNTIAELQKKKDQKFVIISIATVALFIVFHLPRVVPNILELIWPEIADENVNIYCYFF